MTATKFDPTVRKDGLCAVCLGPRKNARWNRYGGYQAIVEWRIVEGEWPDSRTWAHASPRNPNRSQVYEYFRSWGEALDAAGRAAA